ncbi:hypothetical protein SAY86_023358 [Trapa natans]|uniref:R3H domain-containing protein 2-like n=1 Tax=Trapa natans TaxID=22666 RepID=A0AAN7M7F7_TRANT|nr:hypothetical protein SAY86_023358 [Trapa natans]
MEGSVEDLVAPDSWEAADLEESVRRLMLSSKKDRDSMAQEQLKECSPSNFSVPLPAAGSLSEDIISQVDQFLLEALQNPRERLSVLRMDQDMEKFIRDPSQQYFEFPHLPTSYLRLAAHRVAQHYSLQSMVLQDSSSVDGSTSQIIVQKTSDSRLPAIRLVDIPVNLPSEERNAVKVFIKQRPQKHHQHSSSGNSKSSKSGSSKSVEERKEEYNRARARIFNLSNSSDGLSRRPEIESRIQDGSKDGSFGLPKMEDKHVCRVADVNPKMEEKHVSGVTDLNHNRDVTDSSPGSSRSARSRIEKEAISRIRTNNKVAIFRDREVDRNDPDYDRSYDRYTRRFDPGFGFNGGSYVIQPTFTPALNYNTEFPQLQPAHHPQISGEHKPLSFHQNLSGLWTPSSTAGSGYVHHENLMRPYVPTPVGARTASGVHLQSSQYSSQQPGTPYSYSHEHVHSSTSQVS